MAATLTWKWLQFWQQSEINQISPAGLPEKGVVLNANLPKLLGSSVVRKLEANGALKLLILLCKKRGRTNQIVYCHDLVTFVICGDRILTPMFLCLGEHTDWGNSPWLYALLFLSVGPKGLNPETSVCFGSNVRIKVFIPHVVSFVVSTMHWLLVSLSCALACLVCLFEYMAFDYVHLPCIHVMFAVNTSVMFIAIYYVLFYLMSCF